ncbi:MAG: hypothetical protein EP318_17260 [Rhodobacteraceae bacterium]|nr:MAG: hypothetical protein EP318_17260 [Paracoccaceae bacterium]
MNTILQSVRHHLCPSFTRLPALSLVALAMVVAAPVQAEVKCSCPTIKAEGEGNTSCSANESGGQCTIDYNLFGLREVRAAELLSERLNLDFRPFPEQGTDEALQLAERAGMLYEQVLLYLYVAASSQFSRNSETVPLDNVASIERMVGSFRKEVETAFAMTTRERVAGDTRVFPDDAFMDVGEVVITPGCIEVFAGGQWMMFKTYWSVSAALPGCREG